MADDWTVKARSVQEHICAFTSNSIRQIGLGAGDKLVNCVGKVVGLNIIDMRLY